MHESLKKQQYKRIETFITYLNSVEKHNETALFSSWVLYRSPFSESNFSFFAYDC